MGVGVGGNPFARATIRPRGVQLMVWFWAGGGGDEGESPRSFCTRRHRLASPPPRAHHTHNPPPPPPPPPPHTHTHASATHPLQPLRQHPDVLQINVEQLFKPRALHLDHHTLAVHLPHRRVCGGWAGGRGLRRGGWGGKGRRGCSVGSQGAAPALGAPAAAPAREKAKGEKKERQTDRKQGGGGGGGGGRGGGAPARVLRFLHPPPPPPHARPPCALSLSLACLDKSGAQLHQALAQPCSLIEGGWGGGAG